jgi:hypothetical protein
MASSAIYQLPWEHMKWLMHGKASAEPSYSDSMTTSITVLLYKRTRFCLRINDSNVIQNDSPTRAVVWGSKRFYSWNGAELSQQEVSTHDVRSRFFWRVRLLAESDYYLWHVCPSVRVEQLGSHWTDFHENRYFNIFRKYVEKIQV